MSALSSFPAQVDDRTCFLGIGCVPGTSLDLQREGGVTEKHRYWDHSDLTPDLPRYQQCDLEQVS